MTTLRPLLWTGAAAALACLSACNNSNAPEATESHAATAASATIGPDAKPGITAGQGRLVLPAVPGRPGVIYFNVRNDGDPAVLAAVHVNGVGRTEMHQTSGGSMMPVEQVEIGRAGAVAFEPGGLHVMAFDIAATLQSGRESELTLTFADGDKLSMPIRIEAMGTAATKAH